MFPEPVTDTHEVEGDLRTTIPGPPAPPRTPVGPPGPPAHLVQQPIDPPTHHDGAPQQIDPPPQLQIVPAQQPIDAPPHHGPPAQFGTQQLMHPPSHHGAPMAPQNLIGDSAIQSIISSTITSAIMAVSTLTTGMQAPGLVAQPVPPAPPPMFPPPHPGVGTTRALSNSAYRWENKPGTAWHSNKRARASEWHARRAQEVEQGLEYGSLNPKVTVPGGPLCELCGHNQPNIRCVFRCCAVCCPRQHGDQQCYVHTSRR